MVNDIIKLKVDNSLRKRVYYFAKLYTINQTTKYFLIINTTQIKQASAKLIKMTEESTLWIIKI